MGQAGRLGDVTDNTEQRLILHQADLVRTVFAARATWSF